MAAIVGSSTRPGREDAPGVNQAVFGVKLRDGGDVPAGGDQGDLAGGGGTVGRGDRLPPRIARELIRVDLEAGQGRQRLGRGAQEAGNRLAGHQRQRVEGVGSARNGPIRVRTSTSISPPQPRASPTSRAIERM